MGEKEKKVKYQIWNFQRDWGTLKQNPVLTGPSLNVFHRSLANWFHRQAQLLKLNFF